VGPFILCNKYYAKNKGENCIWMNYNLKSLKNKVSSNTIKEWYVW
jgi:hypothetical protein